jgi:chemotaxis protein MotB
MRASSLKRGVLFLPLAAPLLLTDCVWKSDYDALQAKSQAQISQLQQQVASQQQEISQLQGAIKYTVESDLLFASGSYQVSPAGQRIVGSFTQKLAPIQRSKIIVTGYTDNQPVGAALVRQGITDNKVLSQKRAEAVMQIMISQGANPQLLEARGAGDADPVASNSTPAGRAQNRRVEFTLVPAS